MKKILFALTIIATLIVTGCGVSKKDYNKLQSENKKLKEELDECRFGADKLIATIEKAYSDKDYELAKKSIGQLAAKHPESPKNKDFQKLLSLIAKEQVAEHVAEQTRKEAEAKEQRRLANLNNLGIWEIGYYVDDFGEPTKDAYITTSTYIRGRFSNTATHNSALNVTFLISSASNVALQLYEYAGKNPVKAYSTDYYKVLIQDTYGKRYSMEAVNRSDRLYFRENSKAVHNVLLKGGVVKFKIIEKETPTTEYEFTIDNADWYDNAYQKLREAAKKK